MEAHKKTVFVTGSSRGIGKAIADRYNLAGYNVICPTRSELDLANIESVRTYLQRHAGLRADILINNAGENKVSPIDSIAIDDWNRLLTINLTSAFLLTQAAALYMGRRKWGRIVNISSSYSVVTRAGRAAYGVSKAGLNSLTRTAAVELGMSNILVNAICPGFVETELTARNNSPEQLEAIRQQICLGRLAKPEEIADLVYFVGSNLNTYITGQTLFIDGGFNCL
jgi:NAD(P)-dependent dehydrogenase (short-subunit alcohol dehydrogenase family)